MSDADVTVTYLEMLSPAQLRPRACDRHGFRVEGADRDPAVARRFYCDVGADWHWVDRRRWPDEWWYAHVHRPELSTYVGYLDQQPVGYFELHEQGDSGVEIAYFGLLGEFIGQGLGGPLLTAAVERAWALGPKRVWLHTCTLDHPRALANYQARGFAVYRVETQGRAPT
jgi:GNAT superfamily N-acetyltransferase